MATKTTTGRSRSGGTRTTSRRKTGSTTATRSRGKATSAPRATLTDEAKTAIRSVRTRASRAAQRVPTDRTSLSIAAGVVAGLVAAGVAMFLNRDRLKSAATTGGERLRKAADELSTKAHERIDQARDNITRFRTRQEEAKSGSSDATAADIAVNG